MLDLVGLSVVVVTYNNAADIQQCLAGLASQVVAGGVEVIVVDNGSQDGTPDLVRERFPDIRLVQQANLGFGAGNNRGARAARGEILVFLNPDTVPEPGFLANLTAAIAPKQAATGQLVLKSDPSTINTAGHRLHFTGFGFVVGFRKHRWPPGPPRPTQGVSGAAFGMLRRDYDEIGGFDEDFFLYMEDTELSWRMQRAGFRIVVAPSAVVVHDYEFELTAKKIRYVETGRMLLLRKHLPWYLWLAYTPSLLLSELLSWGRAAWMGPKGLQAKSRALRDGLRKGIRRPHLPRARPHRFAQRSIPFQDLSSWPSVKVGGALLNCVYWLNTLAWPLRKDRRPR